MGSSSVNEVLTSGRTNKSDNEGEGGLEQFPGFPGQLVSHPTGSDAFRKFCKAKAVVGEKWGKYVEFTGVKSTVERKESLLDEVVEEETELKLVLGELGLSKKMRVDSRSKKIRKAQSTRSMAGVDEGKRQTSGEDARPNPSKILGNGSLAQSKLVKPSKVAQLFLKKWMLKTMPAPDATESGEVAKEKRKRVKSSGEKVVEVRPAALDDLREVEERARLAALYGQKDTSKMVARLVKGIWLSFEEEKSKLKKEKRELEKDLARAKTEAMKEIRQLKATHVEEVDAIKADTYVEVEDEEAEVVGVMDGLDGVSRQTVLDNQGDDIELPEGGCEKVKEKDSKIKKGLENLSGATTRVEKLQCQVNALAVKGKQADTARYRIHALERSEEQCRSDLQRCRNDLERMRQIFIEKDDELRCDDLNERVARLKAENDQTITRTKIAEARGRSGGSRTEGNVQKGNTNLRECQQKLDAALIRGKVLVGEIKAKDLLVMRKEELLKELPAREELNAEIVRLRARVVDLKAINLDELAQYFAKLKEDAIYHDKVDSEIIDWKDNCARLKVRVEWLKARFLTAIVPGVSRNDLLRVIVAYFIEEVKGFELE
ncbi:hypothetical protein GIB67_036336 [Kingdonia uniflora]|uniref:Uncharacterized protein n=1 Tax=Kingdonia uniflora TaxID=39325 RepID=A0A7J7L3Z7_9MAGN|nr:hypothetical protein GIB67_036336 [Kingdonia uniflora]